MTNLVRHIDKNVLVNAISAQTVVAKYLGEPKEIIGKVHRFPTPFRDKVLSTAPLYVYDKWIVDMGGDFKGDIIVFVAKYHNVGFREAIEIIAKDFNITNLQNYFAVNDDVRLEKRAVKKEQILLEMVGKCDVDITTMFDSEPFKKKPTGKEIGKIKDRIESLKLAPYSLETIKQNIISGYTSIPAGIKGDGEKNWKQQQIFMVDIDNVIKVNGKNQKLLLTDNRHVSIQKVIKFCETIGLPPTFIYKSFSYTEECHKFRLVYVLEKPVYDVEIAKGISEFFKEKLSPLNIDEAPTNLESMFFGGTEIVYSSDVFYNAVKEEVEVEEIEYEIVQDYGDFNRYIEKLEGFGYGVNGGKLCKVDISYDRNGAPRISYTPLSNFLPIITKKTTYINDRDTYTFYNIKGLLLKDNKVLPEITVSKDELEKVSYSISDEWNIQAIKEPIYRVEDELRYISQCISKDDIICDEIYAHTGFIRVNGKLVYLHQGGVIGNAEDLKVDLSLDKLEQYCFTDKEFDRIEALKTSLSAIDVADNTITIPLLATTYLAPLRSLFSENNLLADYVLWLEGRTGTRKSSLTAAILSHFGNFHRNSFPCSFRDTANSLEKKVFILKDSLSVIDDYCPEVVGTGKVGTAEKIFAMFGDRVGRDRMRSDGKTLRGAYTARGLCVITGETFPKVAQSRLARAILLEMKPGDVDLTKLRKLQNDAEKLSYAMKIYIDWVIVNEDKILDYAKKEQMEMEKEFQNNEWHGRTCEAATMMIIGYKLFLSFMFENGVISEVERDEREKIGIDVLKGIADNQSREIALENPVEMFTEAIEQLYTAERVQVLDFSIPTTPSARNTLIGWHDKVSGQFYFIPDVTYKEVVKFYREQGIKFPVSKRTLIKMLDDEGYLYVPKKNDRRTVKRKAPNTYTAIAVIAVYQDKLGFEEFDEEKELAEGNILVKKMQEQMLIEEKKKLQEEMEKEVTK